MVVVAIYQNHVCWCISERLGGSKAAKPSADDYNPW
jgi:hypothetical protein